MRFPTLEEVIACNEAVREPDEASPSADDDDLDRVARALERATTETDPIEAAAALAFEIAYAQGFYEGNKRTAALIARWFVATNTALDPDVLIPPDDVEALMRTLRELHDDKPRRQTLGANARQTVLDNFSVTGMTASTLDLYHRVATRNEQ